MVPGSARSRVRLTVRQRANLLVVQRLAKCRAGTVAATRHHTLGRDAIGLLGAFRYVAWTDDFVIFARSGACSFEGLQEAIDPISLAVDVGADKRLVCPRDDEELRQAPKLYKACIDAVSSLGVAVAAMKLPLPKFARPAATDGVDDRRGHSAPGWWK